ncbi:LUD domain-containing protein [Lacinutrix salivirga]
MSLFRKIFGSKSDKSKDDIQSDDRGKYMPEINIPVDEKFTLNFKSNGGKFLYCDNLNEIFEAFNNIIDENNWQDKNVLLIDDNLKDQFKHNGLNSTLSCTEASYFLTTCENLIADDGSILISSNQIAEKKLHELPSSFIVFATTSQITQNIGEGLRLIKNKNLKKIPTNITTIKHFKSNDEKDFLSYGSTSKNLYLLLLEDL